MGAFDDGLHQGIGMQCLERNVSDWLRPITALRLEFIRGARDRRDEVRAAHAGIAGIAIRNSLH